MNLYQNSLKKRIIKKNKKIALKIISFNNRKMSLTMGIIFYFINKKKWFNVSSEYTNQLSEI